MQQSFRRMALILFLFVVGCSLLPVGALASGGPGGGGGGGGGNGGGGGGNTPPTLAGQLRATWQGEPITNLLITLTLNSNGSFTLTQMVLNTGQTSVAQGSWTLGPATVLQPFANPQGLLTLTSKGQVLLSGNVLLINADLFEILPVTNNITSFVPEIVFAKAAP